MKEHSRIARIFRRLFAPLMPVLCGSAAVPLRLRAVADVRPAGGEGSWQVTGPNPRLELLPPRSDFPSGWVLLKGRLQRKGVDYTTRLFVEVAGEHPNRREYFVPVSLWGTVRELFRLPAGVSRLEFQPMGGEGEFELENLTLGRVNSLEALVLRWRRVRHTFIHKPKERRDRVGLYWHTPLLDLKKAYALAGLLRGSSPTLSYRQWTTEVTALTGDDRRSIRRDIRRWTIRPEFRVLVFAGLKDLEGLKVTLDSIRQQLYRNVQLLVLAPAAEASELRTELPDYDWLQVWSEGDFAPSEAPGDSASPAPEWWLTLPPGAALAEQACYWLASVALTDSRCRLQYWDHDHLDAGGNRMDPHFKPDWSLELLRSSNYIDAALAVRSDLAMEVLGCRQESLPGAMAAALASGGQYDWLLRCSERLEGYEIRHLPAVLLHLPQWPSPTGRSGSSQQVETVSAHLRRLGIAAEVSCAANGYCRVRYALPSPAPLVSLIVPTRDALHHLHACVESVLEKSTYRNFELLVVDNQSADPATRQYLAGLQTHPQIRVFSYEQPFNYSAINNFAVSQARGEVVCLLNNDTEVISPDWLEEMVAHLARPGVGVVGAKLLFDDGRVQHGGDTVGPGGCAHHLHSFLDRDAPGYGGRALQAQDLSAVTGACLLTWRSLYLELGGLDEVHLPVAFNDVDYCLRVRESNRRVVWTPYAVLYHHESVSRGKDDSPEKLARTRREADYMRWRWRHVMLHDPFYNPNLNYERPDFSLNPAPVINKPWRHR